MRSENLVPEDDPNVGNQVRGERRSFSSCEASSSLSNHGEKRPARLKYVRIRDIEFETMGIKGTRAYGNWRSVRRRVL